MNYVLVSVAGIHTGSKFFTYSSVDMPKIGAIVKIPYGNKELYGIIISVVKKPTIKIKNILADTDLVLPKTYLDLLLWLLDFYPDDYGSITSLFIPANLGTKAQKKEAMSNPLKKLQLQSATKQQSLIIKELSGSSQNIILHGDTGTGKTRVFIEQIINTLNMGKSALVLTPEIGLTPQLLSNITDYISEPAYLLHSGLTPAERRRVWMKAYETNEPCVFIGPRSALFLPINNLGLIVVDEAHDSSFIQQQSPKYNSLFVASKLASLTGSKVILSSATPNVSDYYLAEKKSYQILRMTELAVKNEPAVGQIIDQTEKNNFTENPFICDAILASIKEALVNKEQSMLFLNRRGSARLVQCSSCGWQATCPKCGLPLTYHHDLHNLICHTCGYKTKAPSNCPVCSKTDLLYKSPGTKAITEQIQKLFPDARVARFDADVTASEMLHRNIDKLKNGEIDIVIGTQLISKGIDLPRLSVVGVINADTGLNMPDFSSEESTFQQIYQVTGRVGRGHRLSKFFIQTRLPEHPVLQAVLNRNWQSFYDTEIYKRKLLKYPPFCYLGTAKISKKTADTAQKSAEKSLKLLNEIQGIEILGPTPSFYEYSNGLYTWQIVIKSSKRSLILKALSSLPSEWNKQIDPPTLI